MKELLVILSFLAVLLYSSADQHGVIRTNSYYHVKLVQGPKVIKEWTRGGRVHSFRHYWPASTVKLSAAIAFAQAAKANNIHPKQEMTYRVNDKVHRVSPAKLIYESLAKSSNLHFDLMLLFADTLERHNKQFHPIVIQQSYFYPRGLLPRLSQNYIGCPPKNNCITLHAMQNVLHNLTMNKIALDPLYRLLILMSMSKPEKNLSTRVAKLVTGCPVVYAIGKDGNVPKRDSLINDYIFFPHAGKAIMVALSVRNHDGHRYKRRLLIQLIYQAVMFDQSLSCRKKVSL